MLLEAIVQRRQLRRRPDGNAGADAPPCTTFANWSQPRKLDQISTAKDETQAALDASGTHLVFTANHAVSGDLDLYVATWNGTTYAGEQRLDKISDSDDQYDPAWSHDGRFLYYTDNGSVSASPVTAGPTFGSAVVPTDFAGVTSGQLRRPRYAREGTILVFWDGSSTKPRLRYATRRTTTESWTEDPTKVADLNNQSFDPRDPVLSEDGLTLYLDGNAGQIRVATRGTTDAAFDPPRCSIRASRAAFTSPSCRATARGWCSRS